MKRWLLEPVVQELSALLHLFPVLCADFRLPLSPRVYFSDSCRAGARVQYAEFPHREAWNVKNIVAETTARKQWSSSLRDEPSLDDAVLTFMISSPAVERRPLQVSRRFEGAVKRLFSRTAIVHKWQCPGHINQPQTDAQLMEVWHIDSCALVRGHRVIALMDNPFILGAVDIGRSSFFSLNKTGQEMPASSWSTTSFIFSTGFHRPSTSPTSPLVPSHHESLGSTSPEASVHLPAPLGFHCSIYLQGV